MVNHSKNPINYRWLIHTVLRTVWPFPIHSPSNVYSSPKALRSAFPTLKVQNWVRIELGDKATLPVVHKQCNGYSIQTSVAG